MASLKSNKRTIFQRAACVCVHPRFTQRITTRLIGLKERMSDHRSEVFTCEFHPNGELLLSGGIKKDLHISHVYDRNVNVMVLSGHQGAVMEAHFSPDGSRLYSCSSDETVGVWDTYYGIQTIRLLGHSGCINSMQCSRQGVPLLCSGGDDSSLRIWDTRMGVNALNFSNDEAVTAICFNETTDQMYSGSLETVIKVWDIKACAMTMHLKGHTQAITGIALSPCGKFLLSHSLDSTLRIWTLDPAHVGDRCVQVFNSNQHTVHGNLLRCAWSPEGSMVAAGSAGCIIPIWNLHTGYQNAELMGHVSNVNDLHFHPYEPIIASASSDKCVILHDLFYETEKFKRLTYI